MTEYLGRGDPRRTMDLLWGVQRKSTRGRRPGLSVAQIVAEAVAIADAEGVGGVSIRRVAERLGVGAMSLYTYVPGKTELLDLMLDAVYAEHADVLERLEPAPGPAPRSGLEAQARAGWDLHLRHRWILGVSTARSVLGPNETRVLEASLRIVDGLGLSGRDMVAIVDSVAIFVRGAVRAAAEAIDAPQATGMTDNEWWESRAPLLEESDLVRPDRFPVTNRVSADGGFDVAENVEQYVLQFAVEDFEFGLQRLLDGIDAYISPAARLASAPASRRRSRGGGARRPEGGG